MAAPQRQRRHTTMLRLHYYPSTASFAPHIVLEELGVPYQRVLVDREQNAHKSTEYLKLNPNGLIPVLEDGEVVLYETAAILLHLADTHADAHLAPPMSSAARSEFYKWLVWLTNTLQATLMVYFYPERWVSAGNMAGAAEVKAQAEARVGVLLQQLDAQFSDGRPWLLGDAYSAADAMAFMLCRWTRHFGQPARDLPHLGPYLQRMLARPAVQRAIANEALPQPWV
ncbi:glutathione S-transferase family protein [Ideonella paludis]|nr:glutathione S-transferase family protein [Ideonella paludis]